MMRMRTKTTELTSRAAVKDSSPGENVLEVRPGGMLVQKRDPDEELTRIPPPTIRVRVKYGSIYHEIIISATATFGELKKKLTGPTGLHHEDQKIMYKDKERASKTFLDVVGVKDKSKMVVMEDPISKEKRYIEARKNAKIEKATKSISEISLEVDRLVSQVKALDSVIAKGGNVGEKLITNLIELLMNQLLKLDEVKIEGDVSLLKKKQVERVQRYVETLDVLKVKNTATKIGPSQPRPSHANGHGGTVTTNHNHQSKRSVVGKLSTMATQQQEEVSLSKKTSGGVVVTTQWETFDSLPTIFSDPPSTSTSKSTTSDSIQPDFNWDLLLK
uniref:BAG family molecular chaperone regulator 1-like n=1 Tax=Erigeron canadensis TaxID=72917 RepID=UPI001CB91AC3|nr:BAG family molecular chaperone regulator 1-like [Erigeron canadensis]